MLNPEILVFLPIVFPKSKQICQRISRKNTVWIDEHLVFYQFSSRLNWHRAQMRSQSGLNHPTDNASSRKNNDFGTFRDKTVTKWLTIGCSTNFDITWRWLSRASNQDIMLVRLTEPCDLSVSHHYALLSFALWTSFWSLWNNYSNTKYGRTHYLFIDVLSVAV